MRCIGRLDNWGLVQLEISPAVNATADEFFRSAPPAMQAIVTKIRQEKAAGLRAKPSSTFIDKSNLPTPKKRSDLLDGGLGIFCTLDGETIPAARHKVRGAA